MLRQTVTHALQDLKAKDIRAIDMLDKSAMADCLMIASGTSVRHVQSISDAVVKYAREIGTKPLGVEGECAGEWVLVDLGDVIVHVMLPRIREFYGLERLWAVTSERHDASGASAAG